MNGSLQIVLHAHLPFVRHPENPYHLEENWLFEAILETYLPLVEVLQGLDSDGIPGRITLSLSQPLIGMLDDGLLRDRFEQHLARLIRLATQEVTRTEADAEFGPVARFYLTRLIRLRDLYLNGLQRDLVGCFIRLHHSRRIELITCVGTHGFLPLMLLDGSRRGQIRTAARSFEARCGFASAGMWMGECAYTAGVDSLLAEAGVRFSFVDSHAIECASDRPLSGLVAPLLSPGGVAFFGRDPESSSQVWSSHEGYPGDLRYREYYRDVGFDRPLEEVAPFIHPDGIRVNTGLKYHRITSRTEAEKEAYDPQAAMAAVAEHARHFVAARATQIAWAAQRSTVRPVVTTPYDAELFGHWWFEGPLFLDAVLREIARNGTFSATTPSDYLAGNPVQQVAEPADSSWGEAGYFSVWLNEGNAWIYPALHAAEERVTAAVSAHAESAAWQPALEQLCRELMLAQASDWAFIIKMQTTVGYAVARTKEHLAALDALADRIEAGDLAGAVAMAGERAARTPLLAQLVPADWR